MKPSWLQFVQAYGGMCTLLLFVVLPNKCRFCMTARRAACLAATACVVYYTDTFSTLGHDWHKQQLLVLCTAVQAAPVAADSAPKKGSIQKWENGFQLERLAMGKPDGKLAKPGKKVIVKYRGSLASNGKVFDETKGNKTFSFRLGDRSTPTITIYLPIQCHICPILADFFNATHSVQLLMCLMSHAAGIATFRLLSWLCIASAVR